jgi:ABC-type nitrate/sulfonate/bicarbonate transport system substrate-binding protein
MIGRLISGIAITALSMIAMNAPVFAQDKIKVSIADGEITPFCIKMRMVRHAAFPAMREKYKLQFEEVLQIMSQSPVTVAGQDLDIGECTGISTMVNAWNKRAKNLIVWSVGAELPVYQIVANPAVKKLADLKGKNIGSPGIQTASSEAVEMMLKRGAGLLPEKDYNFVSTGGGNARAAALISGKIDALPTFPPISYDLEKRGFNVIADEVTYVPQYVSGVDVVTREWATKNRDLFIRLIKATIETGEWLKNPANKDQVIDWFAKNIKVPGGGILGVEDAERIYNFYVAEKRLSFNGYAPQAAVRANLDILKERGYLKESEIPPLGQIFDFSYLNQALRELGMPQVQEFPTN